MDPRFALLLACFFLSGFAALLYQTAWSRELSFVFGTSDLAVAAVLAAYMGGLALGAAAAARFAGRIRRPVLVYGLLELAIAACALLVPLGIRGLNALYVALLGGGSLGSADPTLSTLFQLASAFLVLLPPTAFMGATLPLLARHAVHREEEIAPRVGLLYAINTVGAIAGTLCAAFWLMPELGLRRTVWIGALLNAVVFGLAAALARRAPAAPAAPAASAAPVSGSLWILPAIALSGTVSFAYEVLWTRLLGHLLGASLHAFSTMLATFLLGIALGSAIASRLARDRARAALGFAVAQLGIAVTSFAAFAAADHLPELATRVGAGLDAPLRGASVAAAVLLPVTLFIGATFPFAVRVLAREAEHAAAATARIYAWNTVGAIAGALGAGFVLLPGIGFEGTLIAGVAASLALAVLAAVAATPRRPALAVLAILGVAAALLAPARTPWRLLTSSPMRSSPAAGERVFAAVGRTTSVVVMEREGRFFLTTDGLPEASIESRGMLPSANVARWLGALPAWLRPDARRVLVVGFGGGMAIENLPARYERIDVIELEPEVVAANRAFGSRRASDPLADPRVHVHFGDARGTLQLTGERFDAIVSQPSHPWTAGASHLYTREFFELVRSRLVPDGVFVQWIGVHFVDEALLSALLAALHEVFPHVEVFRPQLHSLLFAASPAPLDTLANVGRSLPDPEAALGDHGIHTLEDFASRWALDEAGVAALAEGAPTNTDDHNLLAARSSSLGQRAATAKRTREFVDTRDPLLSDRGLDTSAIVRALINLRQTERANAVAQAREGAAEEAALGWVELSGNRVRRAARHFTRALEFAPGNPDAIAGVIASQRVRLSRGEAPRAIGDAALAPHHDALIAGWRHARADRWEEVAALDPELARFEPGEGLFQLAARLRIEWRLERGEPAAAAEAEALARTLLLRVWNPGDAILHARAALGAGHHDTAWGTLQEATNLVRGRFRQSRESSRRLGERVIELARELPEAQAASLRAQLAPFLGGEAPDRDEATDPPARP